MNSLPNLHPAIVHFPVALLVVAVLFDLACVALRRWPWLDRTAAALFALGAAAAWLAVLTGERAADSLVGVPAAVQPLIGDHHDWAERTAWVFTAIALARVAIGWIDRGAVTVRKIPVRVLLLGIAVAAQALLVGTADRGGALVYLHGLAVARTERPAPSVPDSRKESPGGPGARFHRDDDGAVTWRPAPGDAGALGTIVEIAPGSAPVSAVDGAAGLGLKVTGRSLLVLPGEMAHMHVEARIDVSGFRGVVGVAHHVRALDEAGTFELSSEGTAALVSSFAGRRTLLDEKPRAMPEGRFSIAVSAAGRHFKGMVDGNVVTHGHGDPPSPGNSAILLDGEGIVILHELRVVPLPAP